MERTRDYSGWKTLQLVFGVEELIFVRVSVGNITKFMSQNRTYSSLSRHS